MLLMANRTFLTSPPGALPCIARDPEVRLRDIAASRGITGRSAYGTVTDLAEAGTWPLGERTPQPLPDPDTPAAAGTQQP
jgi:hypothetical protein